MTDITNNWITITILNNVVGGNPASTNIQSWLTCQEVPNPFLKSGYDIYVIGTQVGGIM